MLLYQMKKLVLFDIDGTILSFKKPHSKIIFHDVLLELFGLEVPVEEMPDFTGKTDIQILKEIAQISCYDFNIIKNNINTVWLKMTKHFKTYCSIENILTFPGVIGLINNLNSSNNIYLGLLTGNYKQNAYLKLDVFNLSHYFPFGAFGSDSDDRNQLPAIAIERANKYCNEKIFNFYNTVIIGDSPLDIECARQNNIRNVIVATGSFSFEKLIKLKPDYLFNDFSDNSHVLKAILEENPENTFI
jgi:phosphoglycolate phosphatase